MLLATMNNVGTITLFNSDFYQNCNDDFLQCMIQNADDFIIPTLLHYGRRLNWLG